MFLLAFIFFFLVASSTLSAAPVWEALPIPSKSRFQSNLEVQLQSSSPTPSPQTSASLSSTPTPSLTASPPQTVSPSPSPKQSAPTTLFPGLPGSSEVDLIYSPAPCSKPKPTSYSIFPTSSEAGNFRAVDISISIEPAVIPNTWELGNETNANEPPKFPTPSVPPAASPRLTGVKLTPVVQRQCLPASARVSVRNGREIPIADVKVGDYVRVKPGTFSHVLLLSHADSKAVTEMVVINTSRGALTISPGHYIPVQSPYFDTDIDLVAARNIAPGDVLAGGMEVRSVGRRRATGLYNPQTAAGTIMVKFESGNKEVQVSTYTEAVRPSAAHALLAALRCMHKFGGGLTVHALSNIFVGVVDDRKRMGMEIWPLKLSRGITSHLKYIATGHISH